VRVIASLPAIEGLGTDTKIATGKPSIVTTGVIVIKTILVFAWLSWISQPEASPDERLHQLLHLLSS